MDKNGVLKKKYSDDRKNRPELQFRLLSRAIVVRDASASYLKTTSNLNILDMGSAEGKALIAMNNLFHNSLFTGIEYSNELIGEAPPFPYNIKLFHGDITKINFLRGETFNIVSALAVLEHLNRPEEAIAEAYRLLKKGGLFIATCPVPAWDSFSTALGFLKQEQHESKINKIRMIKIVENTGFKILAYKRFMWAPISFLPYLHIPVSPFYALKIDNFLSLIRIFDWLFVNQAIIGLK